MLLPERQRIPLHPVARLQPLHLTVGIPHPPRRQAKGATAKGATDAAPPVAVAAAVAAAAAAVAAVVAAAVAVYTAAAQGPHSFQNPGQTNHWV